MTAAEERPAAMGHGANTSRGGRSDAARVSLSADILRHLQRRAASVNLRVVRLSDGTYRVDDRGRYDMIANGITRARAVEIVRDWGGS